MGSTLGPYKHQSLVTIIIVIFLITPRVTLIIVAMPSRLVDGDVVKV